jgi:hypothetical protein
VSSATKKFALAALSTPVLAALAIGLAGSAVAAPVGPQPSDTGTATTADAFTNATNLVSINLPRVKPIGDGVWGQTDSFKLGTAAGPAGSATRGATQRKGQLGGGGHTIVVMGDETLWGWTQPATRGVPRIPRQAVRVSSETINTNVATLNAVRRSVPSRIRTAR